MKPSPAPKLQPTPRKSEEEAFPLPPYPHQVHAGVAPAPAQTVHNQGAVPAVQHRDQLLHQAAAQATGLTLDNLMDELCPDQDYQLLRKDHRRARDKKREKDRQEKSLRRCLKTPYNWINNVFVN